MAMCRVEDSYQNLLRLVLERESRHQSRMAQKHIAVSTWLEALGMLEYLSTFHQYGGVEELLYIQEGEIRDLGIKNGAHRAKLVSSLRILRDKYQKGRLHCGISGRTSPSSLQQHLQTSPPSPLSHPDYHSLQVSPEKLRQDLQKELNADPSELKSKSWYHGNISRQRADALVAGDGDFLVRDCISRPGDFVLTCCWKSVPLHFMINALVGDSLLGALPKIYYQFEDESFNSIQVLIHYYQSKAKPVTNASSAVLKTPIARSMPLSYYDSKYGALTSLAAVNIYSSRQSPKGSPLSTPTGSPFGSPGMNRKGPKRTGSQPLLSMDDIGDDRSRSPSMDRCDSLPMINTPTASPQLSVRKEFQSAYHQRSGSEPVLTPNGGLAPCPQNGTEKGGSDSDLSKPPPPKPSRIPSVKYKQRPLVEVRNKFLYEDDGRDYSDYCQVKESPSWLTDNQNNVMNRVKQLNSGGRLDNDPQGDKDIYDNNFNNLKKTLTSTPNMKKDPSSRVRLFSDTRFSVIDTSDPDSPIDPVIDDRGPESCVYDVNYLKQRKITTPKVKSHMSYTPYDLRTSLLHSDNKPLDASSMISIKTMVLDGSPKVVAQHMTKVDLQSLNILKEHDFGVGVQSGLELLTLPQGKQLRQDLIERCHCMKLLVMVSTLTCTTTIERARMTSQWIQIASELKTTMGNLFGFVSVMEALLSRQIQRLRDMWLVLRQNHTGSAYLFDTKLKTAYNALNDGSSSLPLQNVCIPHISPVVHLFERDLDSVLCLLPWEDMDKALFGTEILLAHLDTARIIASQFALYRIVGNSVLSEMKENNEMIDVFKTEMQLRLFWGQKGCGVNRSDRHSKFEQLLTVLSDRAEPPGDEGTAV
ncbi:breast cancer anti-estrogen resistance protein 3 homolog isoform X2 [Haliotis rufescens]|uniref:breast cancer anti-estrogen resistance protein 3 homolog isoform X2 n=1 Tax=Haliotis rufescens TaxID=6454 RepID=UPI00201F0635|nr:breast cancer anti-estrogen resistance protein 3 homolog isoform X2 [Haliotis rufescens]